MPTTETERAVSVYRVTITKSLDLLIEADSEDAAENAASRRSTRKWLDWSDADTDYDTMQATHAEAEFYVNDSGDLADTATRHYPVDATGAPWIEGLTSRKDDRLATLTTRAVGDRACWVDGHCLLVGPRTAERIPMDERMAAWVREWDAFRPAESIVIQRDDLRRWLVAHENLADVRVGGITVDPQKVLQVLHGLRDATITAGRLDTETGPALHMRSGEVVAVVMARHGGENAPAFEAVRFDGVGRAGEWARDGLVFGPWFEGERHAVAADGGRYTIAADPAGFYFTAPPHNEPSPCESGTRATESEAIEAARAHDRARRAKGG